MTTVVAGALAGCVAGSAGSTPSPPEGSAGADSDGWPCVIPPGDYPSGKLEALQEACNPTAPPVVGTPIPWLDAPYTGPGPTATPDPAATYPRCATDVLDVTFAGWNTGDTLGPVGFVVARNRGSTTCIVEGAPKLVLLDSSGRALASSVEGDGPRTPAILRPNVPAHPTGPLPTWELGQELLPGYAYAEFRLVAFCDPSFAPAALDATLPNGTHARLALPPLPKTGGCGAVGGSVLQDWWFASTDAPESHSRPATSLQAVARLPDTAVAGQVLRFTVILQNDLPVPVTLEPCPAYTIRLSVWTADHQMTREVIKEYALNCAGVGSIPSQSARSFEMQAGVPPDISVGNTVLVNWWIGTQEAIGGADTKNEIRIVAATP